MLDYLAMLDYLDMLESTKYFGILPNIPQIFYQIFVPGYWAPSLSAAKLFTAPGYSCFVYLNPLFVCWNSFSFFVLNSFMAAKFVFVRALMIGFLAMLDYLAMLEYLDMLGLSSHARLSSYAGVSSHVRLSFMINQSIHAGLSSHARISRHTRLSRHDGLPSLIITMSTQVLQLQKENLSFCDTWLT